MSKTSMPDITRGFPLCFTSQGQYLEWKKSARRESPGRTEYCADCTPDYQAQMIRERRCAYPGTTFHMTEEGFFDGVRPGCSIPKPHQQARRG